MNPNGVALLLVVVGLGLVLWAARSVSVRRRETALGRLVAVDTDAPLVLRSIRYRVRGRPDAVREGRDGRPVPVEVKSRPAPGGSPPFSHRVQLWAYCLLLEEATGRSPPFGVLRYPEGEFRIRWDDAARRELLRLRAEAAEPYDGRANPSPGRCAHCPWVTVCDARA